MSSIKESSLGLNYGWSYGETGWNSGMDENIVLTGFHANKQIKGILSTPPTTGVSNGDAYIVGSSPTGAWVGNYAKVAIYDRGSWLFATPSTGVSVYNKANGCWYEYNNGWSLKSEAEKSPYIKVKDFDFSTGYTITNSRQLLFYPTNQTYYQWNGTLPKVVAAGSTPATSGGISATAWVDRTDLTLRVGLASTSGTQLIYHGEYKLSDYINPLFDEYGYVTGIDTSGSVDASSRINAALAERRVVRLPSGDIKISSSLNINNKNILIGTGKESCRIFRDITVQPFDLVTGIATQRATIDSIWFDSVQKESVTDGTKRRSAIRFWDNGTAVRCNKIKISNCEFTSFTAAEVQPEGTRGVITFEQVNKAQVSGCTFDDNRATCIYWWNANNISVINNDCTGETGEYDTIYGSFLGSFTSGLAEGVTVSGNRIRNTGFTSVNVSGNNVVVSGNTIESPLFSGVTIAELLPAATNVSVTGNVIKNPGIDGISVFEVNGITISGNTISGATSSGRAGIQLYNTTNGNAPTNVLISSNNIKGNLSGIRLRAGTQIGISSNYIVGNTGDGINISNLGDDLLWSYISANTLADNALYAIELTNAALSRQVVHINGNTIISSNISTTQTSGIVSAGSLSEVYLGLNSFSQNYLTTYVEKVFTSAAGKAFVDLSSGAFSRLEVVNGVPYGASTTYDMPSIATGASVVTSVTVTGAVAGDFVDVGLQGVVLPTGFTVFAWVSSSNTVSVRFTNNTGATQDLGSGILVVNVRKPN